MQSVLKRAMSFATLMVVVIALAFVGGQSSAEGQGSGGCFTYLPSPDLEPGFPVLAGDGSLFAYSTSWRSAIGTGRLVTMNPDGSGYQVVADNWVDPATGSAYNVSIGTPSLTADASQMAVNWIPRNVPAGVDVERGTALFSGGPSAFGAPEIIEGYFSPQLSNDGTRALFVSSEITVMELPSQTVLSSLPLPDDFSYRTVKLAGDGQTVAFVRTDPRLDIAELVSYDVATDVETLLVEDTQGLTLYDISDNGERVIYESSNGRFLDDAGTSTRITTFDVLDTAPIDGEFVDFRANSLSADGTEWFFAQETEENTTALASINVDTDTLAVNAPTGTDRVSRFVDLSVSDDKSIAIFNNFGELTPDSPDEGRKMYRWQLEGCDPTPTPTPTPTPDVVVDLDVYFGDGLGPSLPGNAEVTVELRIANDGTEIVDFDTYGLTLGGSAVEATGSIDPLPATLAGGEEVTITATFTTVAVASPETLNVFFFVTDPSGENLGSANRVLTVDPPAPMITFASPLPSSVLAGEEFEIDIAVTNPSVDPLVTNDLNVVVAGAGISEVVSAARFVQVGPPSGSTTAPIPGGETVILTATVKAARAFETDTFDVTVTLEDDGDDPPTFIDLSVQFYEVRARQAVDVHFTVAQLLGCDEESGGIVDAHCTGGGPDGGGQDNQGEYMVRVNFEDQFSRVVGGDRTEFGDFNDRKFFTLSENVIPGGETMKITVEAFDDDGGGRLDVDPDDDPIDLSPYDDELTAVIFLDYDESSLTAGQWTIDGYVDPPAGQVQHWVRGEDTDYATHGFHPAMLTFDISILKEFDRPPKDARAGDIDGDEILDGWEQFGLSLIDVNQPHPVTAETPEVVWAINPAWNAVEAYEPDLLVENDWASNGAKSAIPLFSVGVVFPDNGPEPFYTLTYRDIVESFAAAPIEIQGIRTGINLWIDTGELTRGGSYDRVGRGGPIVPTSGDYGLDLGGGNEVLLGSGSLAGFNSLCGPDTDGYKAVKALHFDANRRWVFRYAITGATGVFDEDCKFAGEAEIAGNDMVLLQGDALVFMHEFGHMLGLQHGGSEDANCKPNYVSVMNYSYADRGIPLDISEENFLLDFSPARLANGARLGLMPALDEANLNEATVLQPENIEHLVRYSNGNDESVLGIAGQPLDYSGDGDDPPFEVGRFDIDFNPKAGDTCGKDLFSPNDTHNDHHDWNAITLGFREGGKADNLLVIEYADDSGLPATVEEALAVAAGYGRTDLELTATAENDGSSTTIAALLRSLDRPYVGNPQITISVSSGVSVTDLPDGCETSGSDFVCTLDSIRSSTVPTDAITLEFGVAFDVADPSPVVVLTATSQDNSVENDPDSSNNTVSLALDEVAPPLVDLRSTIADLTDQLQQIDGLSGRDQLRISRAIRQIDRLDHDRYWEDGDNLVDSVGYRVMSRMRSGVVSLSRIDNAEVQAITPQIVTAMGELASNRLDEAIDDDGRSLWIHLAQWKIDLGDAYAEAGEVTTAAWHYQLAWTFAAEAS